MSVRTIVSRPGFKKDFKKVRSYKNFRSDKFERAIRLLQSGEKLPEVYKDHAVARNSPKHLLSMRIFHASPNICVIYKLDADEVVLVRIGSHSDLELTENFDSRF